MNFDELNLKLSVFLDDAQDSKGEYQFSLPLRCDGWNFAQEVFAEHTLAEKTVQLSAEADGRTVLLPPDFVAVGMVYDTTWTYIQRRFTPGSRRDDLENGSAYWLWAGIMHFDLTVSDLTLDYFASWPQLKYSQNEAGEVAVSGSISVPDWARLPLIHLTAAYCLQPYAIRAAHDAQRQHQHRLGQPRAQLPPAASQGACLVVRHAAGQASAASEGVRLWQLKDGGLKHIVGLKSRRAAGQTPARLRSPSRTIRGVDSIGLRNVTQTGKERLMIIVRHMDPMRERANRDTTQSEDSRLWKEWPEAIIGGSMSRRCRASSS